jgi:steroid delta-isomerase-like uncharacterized protein
MDAREVVELAYAAVTRGDLVELVQLFSADCVFVDVTEPEPSQGREAFTAYMTETLEVLPGFRPENPRFVVEGDRVAAELEIVATHRGEFLGVAGTGAEIRWPASAFYTVDTERVQITREVFYYDAQSLRASLEAARGDA